jgi:ribose/xylose/arabinose/galactoside ABC-type transport system permease subunit
MLKQLNLKKYVSEYGILLVFIFLVIILSIISPKAFAKPGNVINILKQTSVNGILAMGMMFVIISNGIDLSVGSIVGLAGVVSTLFAHPGQYPLVVAIILPILVGAGAGFLNGVGVSYGGIPPFIVTLGSMTMIRGLALIVSGGAPIFNVSKAYEHIAGGFVGTIPYLAIYFLLIIVLSAFVLNSTVFGRRVYAVGGNEVSARVSGIIVNAIRIMVYTISGMMAGLSGLLMASRTISGSPTAGVSYELDAIAAVVIGGVSMAGGVGKWHGVVVGALMIAVIANGLDILGISSNFQMLIKGAIIILAVLLDIKGKKT